MKTAPLWRNRHDGSTPPRGLPDQPAPQLPVDDLQVERSIAVLRRRLRDLGGQP